MSANVKKVKVIRNAEDMRRFVDWIQKFSLEKAVQFTVEAYKKKHSSSQRGYYHGVVVATVAKETGNDPEDVHNAFKEMFLTPDVVEVFGKPMLRRTTKPLGTVEYGEFIDKCVAFSHTELGIRIPAPNEVEENGNTN